MMYTVAANLFVLWLVGLITSYTLGGFIHVLLVLVILIILRQLLRRQSTFRAK